MWYGSTLETLSDLLGFPSRCHFKFFYLFFGPLSPPNGLGLDFGVKSFEDFPFGPTSFVTVHSHPFYSLMGGVA